MTNDQYQKHNSKKNIIHDKSYKFALAIISLVRKLEQNREYILSKQILRSGTSIGANIREADGSISYKEFLHKVTISYKEARETEYWLDLLYEGGFINKKDYDSISLLLVELLKLLTAIQKTVKSKL